MLKTSNCIVALVVILIAGTSAVLYNDAASPPAGYTGEFGPFTCGSAGCHTGNTVNAAGGSVAISGSVPTTYTANTPYTFNLTITHSTANRTKFGFSIVAKRVSDGAYIGTFSPNGVANVALNGNELSSFNSPVISARSTFTYTGLKWTAPPSAGSVIFYYAGNAADGNGGATGNTGDFIYTKNTIGLPITLFAFNAAVKNNNVFLSWQTTQEINSNYFTIEKSYDNREFYDIAKVDAAGNTSLTKNYNFTDANPSQFEKPIYYRLVMVDKDGSKTYSNIVNAFIKANATYIKRIYPNPLKAGGLLHLDLVSKYNEVILLKLIDNAGRLIKSAELNAQKGSNTLDIKIPVNSTGNYRVIIKSSEGTAQQPLMIR